MHGNRRLVNRCDIDVAICGIYYECGNNFVVLFDMPASESHTEVWSKLRSGHQDALLELYRQHYLGLSNYGIKLTRDPILTKDCITQVLLRLWDNRGKLPEVANIRSYLLTCLRHELLAELRSESKRRLKNDKYLISSEHEEKSYEEYIVAIQSNTDLKEKLVKAMEKLTARERELLKMKFFDDLDYDEIARQCNITKRTAYNILHTAVKTLKAELTVQHQGRITQLPFILIITLLFL